jgi:SAM-dependent methyltransferase
MTEPAADYDRLWDEVYGDLQSCGPTHRHMHRLMRGLLRSVEYRSVLDVGVGFGHNLPLLTAGRRIEHLAGIDVSARAIEHVRSRFHGDFQQLDIATDRLAQSYDLVCCALILEHIAEDEAALRNMRELTSRCLLVVTIGGDYKRYEPWERQMGHIRNYARGELEHKLETAGFDVLRTVYWGFPFYSPLARTLQNRMTATSEMPLGARAIARILYAVYFLNSSRRGDLVLALARPR